MATYKFMKIVKTNDIVKAEFEYQKRENVYREDDLRDILNRIDNGTLDNPDVSRLEFERGLRALMIAKDGGLASLLNPGRL